MKKVIFILGVLLFAYMLVNSHPPPNCLACINGIKACGGNNISHSGTKDDLTMNNIILPVTVTNAIGCAAAYNNCVASNGCVNMPFAVVM